jgi:hypothetical protein
MRESRAVVYDIIFSVSSQMDMDSGVRTSECARAAEAAVKAEYIPDIPTSPLSSGNREIRCLP